MDLARNNIEAVNEEDALTFLIKDHEKVNALFADYDKLPADNDSLEDRMNLVQQISQELIRHTQIEEEIFYPAVRDSIDDSELITEAEVSHAEAKAIISQLETMNPTDAKYQEELIRLAEMVNDHIKDEEENIFSKVKEANLDTVALGKKMSELNDELMAETGTEIVDNEGIN